MMTMSGNTECTTTKKQGKREKEKEKKQEPECITQSTQETQIQSKSQESQLTTQKEKEKEKDKDTQIKIISNIKGSKLEQVQVVKKQIEELRSEMDKLMNIAQIPENEEGRWLSPFRFSDFFGERIFEPSRNSALTLAQDCMNDAQSLIDRAFNLLQKAEKETKTQASEEKEKIEQIEKDATVKLERQQSEETTEHIEKDTQKQGQQQQQQQMTEHTKEKNGKQTQITTTTGTTKKSDMIVHKVVPVTKLVDNVSHVDALIRVPFQNLDDIRFNYCVDNNSATLTVRGRQHNTEKKEMEEFEAEFNLPLDVDVTRARARVDEDLNLCVTVPRKRKGSTLLSDDDFSRMFHPLSINSPFHPMSSRRYAPMSLTQGLWDREPFFSTQPLLRRSWWM